MQDLAMVVSNDNEGMTPFETIDAIKAAGFTKVFIQWYNEPWECSQEDQLEYIKKLGLEIIFAHLGYRDINSIWEVGDEGERLAERYIKDIDICKGNNIPMVVMHLTTSSTALSYGEIGLNRLKRITDFAKSVGVKVAFENTKIKGYLEYALDNLTGNNVGICYDAGHCHAYFDDEFDYARFNGRIFAVHLHDNDKSGDQHLLPFDGTIDWEFITGKLKESNYNGPVTLESVYAGGYLKHVSLEFYEKSYKIGEKIKTIYV